ncbi:class I SAM-dependent methyltransferase [soil metagenome]
MVTNGESDNSTAHKAADYESEVGKTIPFHRQFSDLAIDVALGVKPAPKRWLDTGAGPGAFGARVLERAPEVELTLADPSQAMLDMAHARLSSLPSGRLVKATSQELPVALGPFDVVTAIQCHHYGDVEARLAAVRRCQELLREGGALVVFENVRAESNAGQALQRAQWAAWQRAQGRDEATVEKHLAREGAQFFPIRVSQHLGLFAHLGFATVELIWRAYGQAGFLAVK